MQPVAVPPKTGKVAFQQGLIFGVISGCRSIEYSSGECLCIQYN